MLPGETVTARTEGKERGPAFEGTEGLNLGLIDYVVTPQLHHGGGLLVGHARPDVAVGAGLDGRNKRFEGAQPAGGLIEFGGIKFFGCIAKQLQLCEEVASRRGEAGGDGLGFGDGRVEATLLLAGQYLEE